MTVTAKATPGQVSLGCGRETIIKVAQQFGLLRHDHVMNAVRRPAIWRR
jgi:hypothetical protein